MFPNESEQNIMPFGEPKEKLQFCQLLIRMADYFYFKNLTIIKILPETHEHVYIESKTKVKLGPNMIPAEWHNQFHRYR